jgi:hypothetical protein
MIPFNPWLCPCHSRHHRSEWFGTIHLHVARLPALFLLSIGEFQEYEQTSNYQKHSYPFDQNVWIRHTPPPEMWESDLSSFGIRHFKCFLGTGERDGVERKRSVVVCQFCGVGS